MTNDQLQKAEALLDDAETCLRPRLAVAMKVAAARRAKRTEGEWLNVLKAVHEARGIAEARIRLAVAVYEGRK